jgi:hypothetical protein
MQAKTMRILFARKNTDKDEFPDFLSEEWGLQKLNCISGLFLAKSWLKLAKRQVS